MIVFRCDGDARVGAGHVARCLQIALAFRRWRPRGDVGTYDGVAPSCWRPPGAALAPEGAPAGGRAATAVVVDSYEIDPAQSRPPGALPVAAIVDEGRSAGCAAVLSYHLDAERRIAVPAGRPVLGADVAPVSR